MDQPVTSAGEIAARLDPATYWRLRALQWAWERAQWRAEAWRWRAEMDRREYEAAFAQVARELALDPHRAYRWDDAACAWRWPESLP